ncbi:SMP-30/gluconolactonase/LRE family protein [Sphingomonas sp. PB4P5]|uniref:SMP-30/gluconolactonase/LRE family protein n=1 Tax=Parasphingomonas puruogangriensis TaxID=3096155 RepID=UPI002FC94283
MDAYIIIDRRGIDQLGEGPTWSPSTQRVYWVDIVGQALNALDLSTLNVTRWPMPERIGWAVERYDRGDLLAGFKSGIVELSLDPVTIRPLLSPEPDHPGNRLNDAKVDSAGRLWFGSKHDEDREPSGALYRLDADGRLTQVDDGYAVTNGPAFSPDGRYLYHADSGRREVYRFAVDAAGTVGPRELLITFEESWGYPDGMTTDADGGLWIAHWGGGRISRFDPAGQLVRSHMLPAVNITSCTFAGDRLDRLFVTSAALDSPGGAADGALFEIDPGVHGLPPTPCAV